MLEIRDLTVRYNAQNTVLRNVSLTVARGERVAVLGPSGTGKTTLFRAINGFAPASSGSILFDGQEVTRAKGNRLRELRTRIGVVSQRHDLVDALAVHQNVMAGALGRWSTWRALRFLFAPNAEELATAQNALERVGLPQKLRVRTAEISGGEHQRVAIARALVQHPDLLLADEPVASLDPSLAEQILSLLTSLAEENHIALLCSLHQPHLAEKYFSRIIEMKNGEIVADRRPNLSPAQFVGSDI